MQTSCQHGRGHRILPGAPAGGYPQRTSLFRPTNGGTKWSRCRRIAAKACWQHTASVGSEQGYSVDVQDDRRTRERDGEDRANEFPAHRCQGADLGERRLAGRRHRRGRQILRARRIRSLVGGLILQRRVSANALISERRERLPPTILLQPVACLPQRHRRSHHRVAVGLDRCLRRRLNR